MATYVVYPGTIEVEGCPTLMVSLREEKGRVTIEGFSEGSVSQKAGLQVGDIILALDHTSIHSVDDVRIDLLFRKKSWLGKLGTPNSSPILDSRTKRSY